MIANPVVHQHLTKLRLWMHKDIHDHSYQAGWQKAGQGLLSGRVAASSQQARGIWTSLTGLSSFTAQLQKHYLDLPTDHYTPSLLPTVPALFSVSTSPRSTV